MQMNANLLVNTLKKLEEIHYFFSNYLESSQDKQRKLKSIEKKIDDLIFYIALDVNDFLSKNTAKNNLPDKINTTLLEVETNLAEIVKIIAIKNSHKLIEDFIECHNSIIDYLKNSDLNHNNPLDLKALKEYILSILSRRFG